jgi:Fur family transcriptional regulator, ferric uptake regulator
MDFSPPLVSFLEMAMGAHTTASRKSHTKEELRFEGFLRGKKLKLTGERMAILNAVFTRTSHFDAETLHAGLRDKGGDISRATVYRTLDLLVQCGLVRKNSLGSSHANYEAAHDNEHHDHLICLNCNQVIEFFRPDLETLQDEICTQNAFKPMHHSLQIFGLCENCKDKADEARIRNRVAQLHT